MGHGVWGERKRLWRGGKQYLKFSIEMDKDESLALRYGGQLMANKFRFQNLKIWQFTIEIADELFDIADQLEIKKLYRFAEQMRASGMSMSNNIAEGSGSSSKKDFNNFLNIARRSAFENANILIVLERRGLIDAAHLDKLLTNLNILCRQITNFRKTLKQSYD